MTLAPVEDARAISRIAVGLMASKALFAALNLDLFSRLSGGAKPLETLARDSGITPNRLLTLLTACVGLGLLVRDGARRDLGEWLRCQMDRQIYPQFAQLDAALRGERLDFYRIMDDPKEAEHISRGQHVQSLGPAHVMAKLVDLTRCAALLDVAGGTGAFSITLCQRYPDLRATIIDFLGVVEIARRFSREAGLEARITYLPGHVFETEWPHGQDAVLMSYLLSAVAEANVSGLVERAFRALRPGGQLLVHDFMLRDDGTGPAYAALGLLNALLIDPEVAPLTPGWLSRALGAGGFINSSAQELMADTTTLMTAMKPLVGPASSRTSCSIAKTVTAMLPDRPR
ncbi:MAG: methyltransferase [Candidatus Binatia bacterium]